MSRPHKTSKLQRAVNEAVDRYLSHVEDYELGDLYGLVTKEAEKALFNRLFVFTGGNQSRMSRILGLSRITLKKKLVEIGMIK
ncbi:MAG: Fis family transcriptional regulator [Legionellales bacterium]|nr:Fis family transcriptional regulator [Legionellales bacterium]OUX66917.1 MAG: hypothetical protein CBD38_04100 [bacterium TMED178]|tara:strand:- start:5767 stop:6015 length:249 start_codon:yes stop_codon:yes gene_type:complete